MPKAPKQSSKSASQDVVIEDDDDGDDGATVAVADPQMAAKAKDKLPRAELVLGAPGKGSSEKGTGERVRHAVMATRLVPWGFGGAMKKAGDVLAVWETLTVDDAKFMFQRLGFSACILIAESEIAAKRAAIVAAETKVREQAAKEQARREDEAKATE